MSDPFGPVNMTPAQRDFARVAVVTAALGVITRALPHPGAKLFGFLISGFEPEHFKPIAPGDVPHPRRSPVQIVPTTFLNFAPAPLGFAHPETWQVKPNFFLPAGSSKFIPPALDVLGFGTHEQRLEDTAALNRLRAELPGQLLVQLRSETDETVRSIANGTGGPFSRASEIRAFNAIDTKLLEVAAVAELARRENLRAGVFVPAPPVEQAQFSAPREGLTLNLFAAAAPMGSTLPALVQPVVDAAIRNAEAAVGLRRDLAQERADP